MSLAPDTLIVAVSSQPLSVVVPPDPWWQSNFMAGVVGALIGGMLALVGAALSPFFAHWLAIRVTSQQVARRIRADLRTMRLTVGSVAARLNPENGMLEHFGPRLLTDLADKLALQLASFRERETSVLDLRDEAIEDEVSKAVASVASFENLLRRWTSPLPIAGDDIRLVNYAPQQAEAVRGRCEAQCRSLERVAGLVSALERWRWRLPKPRNVVAPTR